MSARTSGGHTNMVRCVLAAVGALALLAACGSGTSSAAKSSPGPTRTGACQGSDPAAAIRAASTAQDSASSYQSETTTATKQGNSHLTLQVQQPDRFHFTDVAPDGHTTEFLAIGSTTWTKSNGTWTASPGLNLGALVKQASPLGESILNGSTFTDVSVDPNTKLAGKPAVIYRFHLSIPSAQLSSDVQLWLASDTCLPLQAISSFTDVVNGVTSAGRSNTTWSDWNAVSIEPPV
jgi:outer membrane lipoprotein-sorting protein